MERQSDTSRFKDGRVIALCIGCLLAGFLIGMLIFGTPWHLPPAWGDIPTWITGIATAVLAIFAIVTAWYARQAFLKQSQEVSAIERQVKDQEELTQQQAELLKVQSGQLELQRQQFDEQRKVNEQQAKVLELQVRELRQSLTEREREAIRRHREQASRVSIALEPDSRLSGGEATKGAALLATVMNASHGHRPIYNAKLHWYKGSERYGTPNPEPIDVVSAYERIVRSRNFPEGTDLNACGAFLTFHDADGNAWMCAPEGGLTEHLPDELDDAAQAAIDRRAPTPRGAA
jgi:hypothetical protein